MDPMDKFSLIHLQPKHLCLRCVLTMSLLVGTSSFGFTATTPADDESLLVQDGFEYQLEGRNDPFLPFVKEQRTVTPVNPDEVVESGESLFGMQLFEPDQLKVVAILSTNSKKIAMMQDLIGQGYPVTVGTLIGRRGMVKEISAKGVIIEETAVTRSGKKKVTQIVMALKPEGE